MTSVNGLRLPPSFDAVVAGSIGELRRALGIQG